MLRAALVAALACLMLAPTVAPLAAQDTPVIVVYHAWPDAEGGHPDADPFSGPGATPLPGLPAERLPATRADGVLDADPAPDGNPGSSVAQVQELQRILALRQATGPGAAISLDGTLAPGSLVANVHVTALESLGRVETRAILVEDGAPWSGGDALRFVARNASAPSPANLTAAGATQDASFRFALTSEEAARVGVAVLVRVVDGTATRAPGEVVNAAWWTPQQAGPTVQKEKAVLVEHVTATWCEPCGPTDQALSLLAARSAPVAPGARYLQPATPWALSGLALGGFAAFLLLCRRTP